MNDNNKLLSIKQIVEPDGLLPISRYTWMKGVETNIFPPGIRIGKKLRFWKREDIEKIQEEGTLR